MKKLLSVFLSMIMVMSSFAVFGFSSSAADSFSVEVSARKLPESKEIEVTVYGVDMKGIQFFDLFMYYNGEQLEQSYSNSLLNLAGTKLLMDLDDETGAQFSVYLNNTINTDEKIQLFVYKFRPLAEGVSKLKFSVGEGLFIAGETEFNVDLGGIPVTNYKDNYSYVINNGEVTINKINGVPEGVIVIPSEFDGYPVKAIASNAFTYLPNITAVVIPDTVTSIGYFAFMQCNNLKDIFVPGSVTELADSAIGWITGDEYNTSIIIHGEKGSAAEEYAAVYSFRFHECSEYHERPEYKLGDVNGDEKITANDARSVLRFSAMLDNPDYAQTFAADVNGDSKITANDARKILRVSAHLDYFD